MIRHLTALCLALLPASGFAQSPCDGTDLISALSAPELSKLESAAANVPFPEGLLWHAARADTRITLFGTYHFEHERTGAHMEALKPHIDAADAVFLELSNEDQNRAQARIAADPSIMFIMEGPTLPTLLGEEDWQALSAALSARAIPSFMAAKFKPIWAAMMLGIGPCEAQNGALNAAGIDERIGLYGAQIGTGSRSLEDFLTVLTLLDTFPQDEQLDMIRLFFDWQVDADDVSYTLRTHYLAQQTALLWEFSRKIALESGAPGAAEDFARFERLLLNERNAEWMDVLTGDDVSGEVFVAVGAGHLPGRHGLLNLLQDAGFKVTRLPFEG